MKKSGNEKGAWRSVRTSSANAEEWCLVSTGGGVVGKGVLDTLEGQRSRGDDIAGSCGSVRRARGCR